MQWKLPLLGLTLCVGAAHAGGLADTGFEAQYTVGLPNMIVANLALSVSAHNGTILYHNATTPQGLAGLLSPALATHSRIRRVRGRLQPLQYEYHIDNRPKKNRHLLFDWKRRRAVVRNKGKTYELPLEDGLVDENTLQLQLIEDVADAGAKPFDRNYHILSGGKRKTRRFVKTGAVEMETALGRFNTVRIERIRRGKTDRVLWLSPEHRYLPLKIEVVKEGRVQRRLSIRTLRLNTGAAQ